MNSVEKEAVLHCLKSMIDEEVCEECPLYGTTGTDHCEKDCVRLAINALEQEPCGDAVSRQAVLDLPRIKTHNVWGNVIYESVDVENVRQLQSVTPQPKMGRWKRISRDLYVQHAMAYYECSECGKKMIGTHNYCPNCGAKMSEIPTWEEGSEKK